MIAAGKIVLILAALQCDVKDVTLEACPEGELSVYDVRTWYDPDRSQMWDCIDAMDLRNRSGGRAKCEIVSGEKADAEKVDYDYSPKVEALVF